MVNKDELLQKWGPVLSGMGNPIKKQSDHEVLATLLENQSKLSPGIGTRQDNSLKDKYPKVKCRALGSVEIYNLKLGDIIFAYDMDGKDWAIEVDSNLFKIPSHYLEPVNE